MKILVTGSKGFIGQNFIKAFPKDWTISSFDIKDNLDTRPKDLNISKFDWVIHLGAISSTTETNVRKIMDLNLAWSIELVEECIKYNVNLQWASSASVYGNSYYSPVNEDCECHPLNFYAQSKYFFEEYMKSKNPPIVWQGFRYFNVYGPNEDHKESQASPYNQFAKQARETGVIRVFEGSENYKRDFIHVDHLIELQMQMLKKETCGIFNLGTGTARSFLNVARDIALLYNAKIEQIPFPEHLRPHYQQYTQACMNKLESVLKLYK